MEPYDDEPRDATERLRARLAGTPIPRTAAPRRAVAAWIVAAMLFVFALGLIANPWFERAVRRNIPGFDAVDGAAPDLTATRRAIAALEARVQAAEARPPQRLVAAPGSGPNERVAALEARLAAAERLTAAATARVDTLTGSVAALTGRVDATAGQTVLTLQAARADADRAQGALAVLAARRALDRGSWPPGLATPLRALFGERTGSPASAAVDAVVALGAAPVTPAALRAGLARLRPAAATGNSWWDSLTAGVSGLVTVRQRDGSGGDALGRAGQALAAGDVVRAEAAVAALPRTPARDAWLAAAARWQAAQRGLAVLEEAALAQAPVAVLPPAPVAALPPA